VPSLIATVGPSLHLESGDDSLIGRHNENIDGGRARRSKGREQSLLIETKENEVLSSWPYERLFERRSNSFRDADILRPSGRGVVLINPKVAALTTT